MTSDEMSLENHELKQTVVRQAIEITELKKQCERYLLSNMALEDEITAKHIPGKTKKDFQERFISD